MARLDGGFGCQNMGALPVFRSNKLNGEEALVHAVFTRHGGVSQSPYNSLNLGHSVGDRLEDVETNVALALRAIEVPADKVVTCHMVHGANVTVVDSSHGGCVAGEADGLATGTPGTFLLMRFADCLPILINDPVQRVVAMAHAGWRGTIANVAGAAVRVLIEQMGCRPANIRAILGPAIGPCCYRVGDEVIEAVDATFGKTKGLLTQRSEHHASFDLWEANRRLLRAAGIKMIDTMNICTACRNELFFSHRADGGVTGRFGAVIGYRV